MRKVKGVLTAIFWICEIDCTRKDYKRKEEERCGVNIATGSSYYLIRFIETKLGHCMYICV